MFRLHYRPENTSLFGAGRILLQFMVDVAAQIEQAKLLFLRSTKMQITLRAELYQGISTLLSLNIFVFVIVTNIYYFQEW